MKTPDMTAAEVTRRLRRVAELRRFCRALRVKHQRAQRLDPGQIEVMNREMASILRQKTPAERLRTAFALWDSSCSMLKAHLSSTHPEWTPECVRREVAHRLSHGTV